MNRHVTYVVGHKNPDTDSVCSAMAYARLRQAQGMENVLAGRAGNLNRQTEFVLDEIGATPPTLLVDVFPRVRDVVGSRVVTIEGDAPLTAALELFHRHNIRFLPVVDGERRPIGSLVLKKVSERFLIPGEEAVIRRVHATPASIARCLKATPLHMVDAEELQELNLYVGAMSEGTFQQKVAEQDRRRMILITGDRDVIQRSAVEQGVRVLIVTGSLEVSPEIVEIGRSNDVTILSTPYDTATSTWLTRLATPVSAIAGKEFVSVGMGERVDDLRLRMMHSSDPGVIVVDGEGCVTAVATKSNLLSPSPVKLILVDHNELTQSVDGADKVEIVEVVDHHRLGNFHTDQPIRFVNQPLGSTCTVVATLYRQSNIAPDPDTASLMLAGLLSDTVILKSPTTTETDRQIAEWLGELSGRDPLDFGQRIFAAGSALAAYPTGRELVLADFKEYRGGESSFGVGQVEVVSFHEFHSMKKEITAGLEAIRREKGLDVGALLVTDIVQETSLLLALGGRDLPYRIGYPRIEENLYELKGVLSRKKQLLPHLLKVLG